MKELYLIPKHLYDAMKIGKEKTSITGPDGENDDDDDDNDDGDDDTGNRSSVSNKHRKIRLPKVGEQWRTRILPPQIQNQIKLKSIHPPEKNSKNGSLYEQLNLEIGTGKIARARLILKHFENSNKLIWGEHGDLYSPLSNYNVINIIRDFIYQEDIGGSNKLEDYKYLVSITGLPKHLIENKALLRFLSADPTAYASVKKKSKKKTGAGLLKEKYYTLNKWKPY